MVNYRGVKTLEVLEGAKNYNRWIASEMSKYITAPVLEIGAGSGSVSSLIIKKRPYTLSDIDSGLVKLLNEKFKGKIGIAVKILDIEKKPPSHLQNTFKSIVGVNVFEHIRDDRRAFIHANQLLKKRGRLIMLVPAKQFAFTKLDRELGHFSRYEKAELEQKLLGADLSLIIYIFNLVGLISWLIRDRVDRSHIQLKPYQIKLFDSIVPILRFVETKIRPVIGISLIVVARKV